MLRNILGKTVFEYRRSTLWWSVGFAALAGYLIVLFPTVRDNPTMRDLAEAKLETLRALIGNITDFAAPVGSMTGGLFSLALPLMFLFFTIAIGANAIGGEEERKTIDLLLANPITRSRIVLEKFGAMVLLTVVLGVVTVVGFAVGGPRVGLVGAALPLANVAAGMASAVLLGLFFGTLALAAGAATGSRSIAIAVASGAALVNYLIKTMASVVPAMANVEKALPLYFFMSDAHNPLRSGLEPLHAGYLLVGIALLLAVAVITFERRDVAV